LIQRDLAKTKREEGKGLPKNARSFITLLVASKVGITERITWNGKRPKHEEKCRKRHERILATGTFPIKGG